MPATSSEAIARKNRRRYERLKAQLKSDPQLREKRKAWHRARLREKRDARPFIAVDGEGIGHGGEEKYVLFRIGDRELYKRGRRLRTPELLQFILEAPSPKQAILTAFAFEYDCANILRDVPMHRERHDVRSRMERILHLDADRKEGVNARFRNQWTWLNFDGYREFGVMYLPRHFLKVCYAEKVIDANGKIFRQSLKGSIRTIEDSFGFFQSSFLRALNNWGIGEKHWSLIKRMKARRSSFERVTKTMREYNCLECQLHAELMTALRAATLAAGIELNQWDGAGRIASYMLKANGARRRVELQAKFPKTLLEMAHAAYYGGRFEVTRIGMVAGPVHEADINSAYPAGLQAAPCHLHGKWHKAEASRLQHALRDSDTLFVAPCTFNHPRDTFLCGLPFRQKSGSLMWPKAGRGVYWSPELRSAMAIGATIVIDGPGWLYERRCDCRPYGWLQAAYDTRKALGKTTRGIPLKLGINAIYGKLAQRIGGAPWANPIDAGVATAVTRAKLNMAIAVVGPHNVIMLATDAIYSIGAAPRLDVGGELGQWDLKRHPRLFVVKPGLYWPPRPKTTAWRIKSRGLSPKFFEPMVSKFQKTWFDHIRSTKKFLGIAAPAPAVTVKVSTFVGLRLAFHLQRFDAVCRWVELSKAISFDWRDKRAMPERYRRSFILAAKAGDPRAYSLCYTSEVRPAWQDDPEFVGWREDELQFEAMPDHVDLTIPFK